MKYEYATRSEAKIDSAKAALIEQAARKGEAIIGFHVKQADDHPRLQAHDFTAGVPHWIVEGYTSQGELDAAKVMSRDAAIARARSNFEQMLNDADASAGWDRTRLMEERVKLGASG